MNEIIKEQKRKYNDSFAKKKFNNIEVFLILVMGLLSGILFSTIFQVDFSDENVSNDEIISVFNNLKEKYYGEISEEELKRAAIDGMINILNDEYSNYLSTSETEEFNDKLNGEFTGLGVEIMKNNDEYPVITKVYEASPAFSAGIKENDVLLKINNEDIKNLVLNDVVSKIKNKEEEFNFEIKREDKILNIIVTTGKVEISSVIKEIIEIEPSAEKKIGYAKISIFAKNTYEQLEKTFKEFEDNGINSVILDLRDNPGGHLDVAHKILNMFLDDKNILYQIKSKDKIEKIYGTKGNKKNYKMVILINGESASASEVITAALMEEYGAVSVGTKTYGKGTVQQTMTLSDGSMIKYTTNNWLTPKGNNINEIGITPTHEIVFTSDDVQKQKAIEILKVE